MRARNIKPGIFKNEILGQVDPIFSLLFIGLWGLADREGVLEDRPLRIKAELFPYRESLDINGELTQLTRWGFLQRYQVDGQNFIHITNFQKHQSPHHTEKKGTWPLPNSANTNGCDITVGSPLEHGGYPPDSLIPDSLIPDSSVLPPTPSANAEGIAKGEKVRVRRTKQETLAMFSPDLSTLVNSIAKITPKEQPDHSLIRLDVAKLADRLDGLRKESPPELTDSILLKAWEDYLASKPKMFKAPQNFFGKQEDNGDGANWKPWARLAYHKLQKEQMKQAVEA